MLKDIAILGTLLSGVVDNAWADSPIIQTIYTADPAPLYRIKRSGCSPTIISRTRTHTL
jgi:hypothetical protein